ncbi:UDP-2,3-diacylglucosamine diphosphatase [Phaeodactylibacter luteus]|uniref:UDP-2,3-diacylglucosamine diphosphatase n=1 Tax=Phaeodactylibacter luteus TaxID=1564516 RepID=A0A5C6RSH4_9BACT|nr:UDP-2,3-diacylglucosamine diphosphatase [Phaeodactylibacter luteus]TXB64915.1 UDP-2,3-diacylglucosamine diphosphatase [Phaeodactylibacter luteus]
MKRELDIVIISDVHLGTYGCHAKELLNYLKSIKPETLILNGDFVDMWQFRKRYFPKEHIQVIQRILKMAAKGTKVYYITGNHDDALRRYSDFSSGNIHLRDKLLLQLKDKTYWIFHGDIFDLFIQYSPFISKLGGKGYDWLIVLNRFINKARMAMGKPRMSFAKRIKASVKEAIKFIGDFEDTAIQLAAEKEYDYVICGHIHRAQMRTETVNGRQVSYLNSGDWVESLTALEYNWGRWSIYEYDEADYEVVSPKLQVKGQHTENAELLDEDLAGHISTEDIFQQITQQGGR